jgi:hypothetical protein
LGRDHGTGKTPDHCSRPRCGGSRRKMDYSRRDRFEPGRNEQRRHRFEFRWELPHSDAHRPDPQPAREKDSPRLEPRPTNIRALYSCPFAAIRHSILASIRGFKIRLGWSLALPNSRSLFVSIRGYSRSAGDEFVTQPFLCAANKACEKIAYHEWILFPRELHRRAALRRSLYDLRRGGAQIQGRYPTRRICCVTRQSDLNPRWQTGAICERADPGNCRDQQNRESVAKGFDKDVCG